MEIDFVTSLDFRESLDSSLNQNENSIVDASNNNAAVSVGTAVEGQLCGHCNRIVPHAAFTMHEMACQRRNRICEKCKTVVEKSSWDAHLEEFHALIECKDCGDKVEKWKLQLHQQEDCPERKVLDLIFFLFFFLIFLSLSDFVSVWL
jgi:hypothetical protein